MPEVSNVAPTSMPSPAAAPRPEPILVPPFPPLARAVGLPFVVWLFGSLTYTELVSDLGTWIETVLFGSIALVAAAATLDAWVHLACIRRIGLRLDSTGLRSVASAVIGLQTTGVDWSQVAEIRREGSDLVLQAERAPTRIGMGHLLEHPDWILERARALHQMARGGPRVSEEEKLTELEAELEPVTCQRCGGAFDLRIGVDELACPYCGSSQGMPRRVAEILERIAALLSSLPEDRRQLQQKTLRRLIEDGGRLTRQMIQAGWATAALWLLFGGIDVLSTWIDKGVAAVEGEFPVAMVVLAIAALGIAYGLAAFVQRLARAYAQPVTALPPLEPGGAARCRLCGADLPETGALRRCESCGSDSVIAGQVLARAERTVRAALAEARRRLTQSTESGAAILEHVASSLAIFAFLQIFWFHIPLLAAHDGSYGLLRVLAVCAAVSVALVVEGFVAMRWLARSTDSTPDPERAP